MTVNPGSLLPLCMKCESGWQASPERIQAATARQRFVDHVKEHGLEPVVAPVAAAPKPEKKPGLTIREAQEMVGKWADRVFPDRTVHTSISKLMLEEIPEFLLAKANDADEYADLMILVLDVAHQKGIDVEAALTAKHRKNTLRAWAKGPTGSYQHVPGSEAEWPGMEEKKP
jgi:hypothetical protein